MKLAGIYIHIPFCKQACTYCDFHFSTNLERKRDLVSAIELELIQRHAEIPEPIETIYFGGGTPSLLSYQELQGIFDTINAQYHLSNELEVTMECNPDDIQQEALKEWRSVGVNRLSLGVQSFDDEILTWMNRAHDSSAIIPAMELARNAGFANITVDLIYGIPNKTLDYWQDQLKKIIKLKPDHVSAYCLTVEDKTALHHQVSKNQVTMPSNEEVENQFKLLISELKLAGIQQYEVSNFALPGKESKHNSSYWLNKFYIGIGPSAHSFNGNERRWNISNNNQYHKRVINGDQYWETEVLSKNDRYNELLLTGLRTIWGVSEKDIQNISKNFLDQFHMDRKKYEPFFEFRNGSWGLNQEGLLLADKIASDLFIVD